MKALLNEFKEFINRGNVMDMAVGVIIGGAFTAIVTSLTDNIINPLISVIAGGSATEISGLVVPGTNHRLWRVHRRVHQLFDCGGDRLCHRQGFQQSTGDWRQACRRRRGSRAGARLPVLPGGGPRGRDQVLSLRK